MSFLDNNRPYKEEEICPTCKKSLNDLVDGTESCMKCNVQMMVDIAARTSFQHFLDVWVCIFHFEFLSALVSIIWCIARLFKIGDYNPKDGMFAGGKYHPERDLDI